MDKPTSQANPASDRDAAPLFLALLDALNRASTAHDVAENTLRALAPFWPFDGAFFLLLDGETRVKLQNSVGLDADFADDLQSLAAGTLIASESDGFDQTRLDSLTQAVAHIAGQRGWKPTIIPLQAGGPYLGIMALACRANSPKGFAPTPPDDFLRAIGLNIGLALERALKSDSLASAGENLRRFISDSPDGLWEMTLGGQMLMVNQAAADILEYTQEEILAPGFVVPLMDTEEERLKRREMSLKDGFLKNYRVRIRSKSGKIKSVNETVWFVRDEAGRPIRAQAVVRDVSERVRIEEELVRRNEELRILNQIGVELSFPLDLDRSLGSICDQIVSLTGMDSATVLLCDDKSLSIKLIASSNVDPALAERFRELQWTPPQPGSPPRGPLDLMLGNKQTLMLADMQSADEAIAEIFAAGYRSAVVAPIRFGDDVFGVLGVGSRTARSIAPHDKDLVENIALRLAISLRNKQLFRDLQKQLSQLEALAEMSTFASSLIDEHTLIGIMLDAISDLFQAPLVTIYPFRDGKFEPTRRRQPGLADPLYLSRFILSVLENRVPFVYDSTRHPEMDAQTVDIMVRVQAQSFAVMPMQTVSGPVGLLAIGHREPHVWTPEEIESLRIVGNQVATAMANARLYAEQKDRANRMRLLSELARACAETLPDPMFLDAAAEQVRQMLSAEFVSLRPIRDEYMGAGVCAGYEAARKRSQRVVVDAQLKRMVDSRQFLTVSDLDSGSPLPSWFHASMRPDGARSFLALPLVARDEPVGLLSVFRTAPHEWSSAEIQFAQTVANTVALSFSNANLFESVQQQQRELQATLDSVFSGVFTTDRAGVIKSWNRAAADITHRAPDAVIGKNWATEIARVGDNHPDELIFEAMEQGDVVFGIAPRRLISADDREIPLAEAAAPLRGPDGQILGAVGAFWDRTQERQAERARLDFTYEVSHELRNSLTAVLPMAEMLRDPQVKGAYRERAIEAITHQIERIKDFANRFLSYETSQRAVESGEQVDIDALLAKLLVAVRAQHADHFFEPYGSGGAVFADEGRLTTVMLNLLDNAAKYSPKGGTISVRFEPGFDDRLQVAIHNFGPPIPRDILDHIFERGYRGASGEIEGTGIGLWLVQTRLREMGAEVRVEQEEGAGITFCFALRRAPAVSAVPPAAKQSKGRIDANNARKRSGGEKRATASRRNGAGAKEPRAHSRHRR